MTGNVSYDPENHDLMTRLRAAKVAGSNDIPLLEVDDPDGAATLVLGWGSTYGPIAAAVRRAATGTRSRRPTCTTSTPSRATRARCCAATTRSSSPR